MSATRVIAVDLGATSVRVASVDLERMPLESRIEHRAPHVPVRDAAGVLRWQWDDLMAEVEAGLEKALADGPVASIGIDTWGVDYGLLDAHGRLLAPPVSYRDGRTAGWRGLVDRVGGERLYRLTGVQLMEINTIFQLAAHDRAELGRAKRLLLLPELVVHRLTGVETGEVTSAGTSALVDLSTGAWSPELLDAAGVDAALMPQIARGGTRVGAWRGVPVHLVGGHDTASAVAAMPAPAEGAAFVCTGTWFLVGAERPTPNVSDAARDANFSNEMGALGGVRFLKNVAGLWLVEECRRRWGEPPVADLFAAAEAARDVGDPFDPNDPRFTAPADMDAEIRAAARLDGSASQGEVVRCIVDSLARATRSVLDELAGVVGAPVSEVHLLGGGARIRLLRDKLREHGVEAIRVGPVEATALGNALVQGVALGRFDDLAHARTAVAVGE